MSTFTPPSTPPSLEIISGTKGNDGNPSKSLGRADEVADLVGAVMQLIVPFIRSADDAAPIRATGEPDHTALSPLSSVPTNSPLRTALVDSLQPKELAQRMQLELPAGQGHGKDGLLDAIRSVLQYSVNTWDQGFMDKLTASTNAPGVVSELVLAALNTNVHVYHVSPALTVVEKTTAKELAALFGLVGPYAGGITCQGGSSSNQTSLVIARNTLFPETKASGNGTHRFAVFTSADGHYSIDKAAKTCGMGSESVIAVPTDSSGRMDPTALRHCILEAEAAGKTPLYVNATAGTTVLGAYDPIPAISTICKEFKLWLHVDGSWGGAAAFSATHAHKLTGSHLADSLTINPHKMLNVPMTCSFLLTRDTRVFHAANSLPAGYLFHEVEDGDVWDLADLTLQCGRRADSLKLALAWRYYGKAGFEAQIDHAFGMAALLARLVVESGEFTLVSPVPLPCLQVCFYYSPGGKVEVSHAVNSARTKEMVRRLVGRGFMVDFAPGPKGSMFRIVVNCQTLRGTVEGLVRALEKVGREVLAGEEMEGENVI